MKINAAQRQNMNQKEIKKKGIGRNEAGIRIGSGNGTGRSPPAFNRSRHCPAEMAYFLNVF
ncbi:MAG TPA: hypothetical protein DIS74_01825 [Bacteroidales bacterium]|nr:hypothetical protein [Bacteroidales bacterium]